MRKQAGEKDVLTICFPTASLASYSTIEAAWMPEAGTYTIRVGVNSRDTRIAAIITLNQTVKTKQHRNVFSDLAQSWDMELLEQMANLRMESNSPVLCRKKEVFKE